MENDSSNYSIMRKGRRGKRYQGKLFLDTAKNEMISTEQNVHDKEEEPMSEPHVLYKKEGHTAIITLQRTTVKQRDLSWRSASLYSKGNRTLVSRPVAALLRARRVSREEHTGNYPTQCVCLLRILGENSSHPIALRANSLRTPTLYLYHAEGVAGWPERLRRSGQNSDALLRGLSPLWPPRALARKASGREIMSWSLWLDIVSPND